MKFLMNNSFTRLVLCVLFLSSAFVINAQSVVTPTEAQSALIQTLNGDTDDNMELIHQVKLALKNLDQAKADKKYTDKQYDSLAYQLMDLEESLKQTAVDNRISAKKNSVVKPPRKTTDVERATEILKQKLKEGVIDEPTYHKRLQKLKNSVK